MISVALFNNKGWVGKTTLTYHLAHMLHRMDRRVLAVDLDPQSNLTAAFLDDDALGELWDKPRVRHGSPGGSGTVASAVQPLMSGVQELGRIIPILVDQSLWLAPGDLELGSFEDHLVDAWSRALATSDLAAVHAVTALHSIVWQASADVQADIALIDLGPSLGPINRAALLAADAVLVPLAADPFLLRGLQSLGATWRHWRATWQDVVLPRLPPDTPAPSGEMAPLGYVVMRPAVRLDRPKSAYQQWLNPAAFAAAVLGRPEEPVDDSYEIATLRNYQSLMPLAHDARKPMFDLRSGDGALGSTQTLVQRCYQDFRSLSERLLERLDTLER